MRRKSDESPMTPERARALMEIAIDDCPLCIAERARTGKPPEPILSWTMGDPLPELPRRGRRRR